MKTLLLRRDADTPLRADTPVTLLADSAVTLPGRPIVMPTPDRYATTLIVAPALRIGRLGKAIPGRFAPRYIDGISVALIAEIEGTVTGWLDGSVTFGEWLKPQWEEHAVDIEAHGTRCHIEMSQMAVADCIETITRFTTVKTGDVIVPLEAFRLPGSLTRIEAFLDNTPVLSKRII